MSTIKKTDTYCRALRNVKSAEASLESAREFFREAEQELVKWLLPEGAKPGATYGIWVSGHSFGYGKRDVLVSLIPKMKRYYKLAADGESEGSEERQDGYTVEISSPGPAKEPEA